MFNVTTFAATEATGLAALGIDPKAFVIQLITFVLAFFVLRRFAFGPITKALQERRETIESGVTLGESMQREKADLQVKIDEVLHKARQEADAIIAGAQDTAKQTIREAEDTAKDKAAGILKAADSQIEQETARARLALEKEIVGLIADATEAIIDEKVDTKKDAQLIQSALKGRA